MAGKSRDEHSRVISVSTLRFEKWTQLCTVAPVDTSALR